MPFEFGPACAFDKSRDQQGSMETAQSPGKSSESVMFINEVLMLVGGSLTTMLAMIVMVRPKHNNPWSNL